MKKKGKPIQVESFYKFNQPFFSYTVKELYALLHSHSQYIAPVSQLPYQAVKVTTHAWNRWRSRVSTSFEQENILQIYIHEANLLGRIQLMNEKFGLLNGDIVFYYELEKDVLEIKSFYGRISETPVLASIDSLYHVIDVHRDKINLNVNQFELDTAKILPLPNCNIRYQGDTAAYMFEVYQTKEGLIGYVIQKDSNKRIYWKLDEEPKVRLTKSIITALKIYRGTCNMNNAAGK